MPLASQRARIAVAASPAPRKMALIRKSRQTETFAPSRMRVKCTPCSSTHGEAPIARSRSGAKKAPAADSGMPKISPSAIAWTAVRAAASSSFSPMRRATSEVAPMESPKASA